MATVKNFSKNQQGDFFWLYVDQEVSGKEYQLTVGYDPVKGTAEVQGVQVKSKAVNQTGRYRRDYTLRAVEKDGKTGKAVIGELINAIGGDLVAFCRYKKDEVEAAEQEVKLKKLEREIEERTSRYAANPGCIRYFHNREGAESHEESKEEGEILYGSIMPSAFGMNLGFRNKEEAREFYTNLYTKLESAIHTAEKRIAYAQKRLDKAKYMLQHRDPMDFDAYWAELEARIREDMQKQ